MYTELGPFQQGCYCVADATDELLALPSTGGVRMATIEMHKSPRPIQLMMFSALIALRAQAAPADRRPPLNTADFLGTHYIFWIENEGRVMPVGGYRTVGAADCQSAGVMLPVFPFIKHAHATEHEQAVNQLLDRHGTQQVAFSSNLLIAPAFRRTRQSAGIHELVAASVSRDVREKFKIGLGWATTEMRGFFERLGYRPLTLAGRELPPIPCNYTDTDLSLMALTEPSGYAVECLEKHAQLICCGPDPS